MGRVGLLTVSCLLFFLADALAQGDSVKGFSESDKIVYKTVGGSELGLYIARPAGWQASDRRGAIVFFHGGGWRQGTPYFFASQAKHLAEQGMVVFGPEYRLRTPDNGVSPLDCVTDAKSAMRWVRSHAGELGIDPDRIAAGGGSSGGHLAAAVAIVPGLDDAQDDLSVSPRPSALVLFNPAVDLTILRGLGDRAIAGSPQHHIAPGNPPAILFHGTDDHIVPFAYSEAFTETMIEHGNACELVPYEGAGHGFFGARGFPGAHADTLRRMTAFLTKHGFIDE